MTSQSHPNKDYRIHFRRDWTSSSHGNIRSSSSSLFGDKSNSPPPFLFQLLNQTTNPDLFFDEIIGADVSGNVKLLQVRYSPALCWKLTGYLQLFCTYSSWFK